jgi:hypothetical protein
MPSFAGYSAPGMPYPSGNPFFASSPDMVSMPTKTEPPSSPPTSTTANCTVEEFCEKYNLGEGVETGLERLGFRFGDDLSGVTSEEYTRAGIKPLEWRRLLKAYKRLKDDSRQNTQ